MKILIVILLLCSCGVPKEAPRHVRTMKQANYYVRVYDSIYRAAKVTDSIENLKNIKP